MNKQTGGLAGVVGLDKVAGEAAEKAARGSIAVVKVAAVSAIAAVVVLVLLLVGAGGGAGIIALNNDGFPLPPNPVTLEVSDAEDAENATADLLMPPGWADLVWDAQEATSSAKIGIPWTVVAGLLRGQTDFGRTSPYDSIDRDPDRDPKFGAPGNSAGSSGAEVSATSYDGPATVIGGELASNIAARMASLLPNDLSSSGSSGVTLRTVAAAFPAKANQDSVLAVLLDVPVNGDKPAKVAAQVRAAMKNAAKGTTVLWVTQFNPQAPAASKVYNQALRNVAKKNKQLKIVDFAKEARANKNVVNKKGNVTEQGRNLLARMLADAVQTAPSSSGWVTPLKAGTYTLSAYFGKTGPYWGATGGRHSGQDFSAAEGTPIYAAADGVVTEVKHYIMAGNYYSYGTIITIQHAGGIQTRYAHSKDIVVKPGDRVRAGQNISKVSTRGNSTGPHLHLEAKLNGTTVDPMQYLPGGANHNAVSYTPAQPINGSPHSGYAPGLYAEEEEDGCWVDTPGAKIGGDGQQSFGAFLLRPRAKTLMEEDGFDPNNYCDQAEFVSEQLIDIAQEKIGDDEYREWEKDTGVAKKLWQDVITESMLFANPRTGRVTCSPRTVTDVAAAIRYTFQCEGERQDIQVVADAATAEDGSIDFDVLTGEAAIAQLTSEALTVAYNYSKFKSDKCNTNATYAGVFPLTKKLADSYDVTDRCDPRQNILAAAQIVMEGEAVPLGQRSTERGPYRPMVGGWGRLSYAMGETLDEFSLSGPKADWSPSNQCSTTVQTHLTSVATANKVELQQFESDGLSGDERDAIAKMLAAGPDPRSSCGTVTDANYFHQVTLEAEALANALQENEPEPAGDEEQVVDEVLADAYMVLGAYAAHLVSNADTSDGAAAKPGVHSLVHRLTRTTHRIATTPDDGTATTDNKVYPFVKVAVSHAVGYGGVNPLWDSATVDVLAGDNILEDGVFSAGGDATTVINAAKQHLGVPYSWGGGGPSGPTKGIGKGANTVGFDCSGLTEFAFSKAGYNIGGTSRAQVTAGKPVKGLSNALPGDLLFWGAPSVYHVAIYMGDGKMIHAPRTGDVVKIAPVTDGVSFIRRVIPENQGNNASVSYPTNKADAKVTKKLRKKLPANGKKYAPLFAQAGRKHNLDPALIAAVAQQESGFSPDVITCSRKSSAGAQGIMQFMPATANGMGVAPCDPLSAIDGGAKYLKQQYVKFGNVREALAAYNFGPGNVSSGRQWPLETRNYVTQVPQKCRALGGCRGM